MLHHNYILKYNGSGQSAVKALQLLRSVSEVKILDDSAFPKMILVSAGTEMINQLKITLFDWLILPEKTYPVPTTKKQIKKNISFPTGKNGR